MKTQTQIFSIFSQIEAVAAEVMIKDGTANKIHAADIPPTARYNDKGEVAQFAVVIGAQNVQRFEQLIRDLRA